MQTSLTQSWRFPAAALVMFGLGCVVALVLAARLYTLPPAKHAAARSPVWSELAWPFPTDEWGKGKAFHCPASECGSDIRIYLRPKIGFCNCATGVSDDDELDRVSDFNLIGSDIAPVASGLPVKVAALEGRSRLFRIGKSGDHLAMSTAFNNSCDVMVATSIVDRDAAGTIEPLALGFLNSPSIAIWTKQQIGMKGREEN